MRLSFRFTAALLAALTCPFGLYARMDTVPMLVSPPLPDTAPATLQRANRELQRRVNAALARVRGLNATRILVRAQNGNVILAGSVMNADQATLAVDTTRHVDGVVSVTNRLRTDGQGL